MNHIICKGCQRPYSESQKPFILPCGHNLCVKCISKRIYSERCFFCPFDNTFIKFENCKLDLFLLKQSARKLAKEDKKPNPKDRMKVPTPILKTPKKQVNFLEVPKDSRFSKDPKDDFEMQNESICSINTEYLYPSQSEKKMLKIPLASPQVKKVENNAKVNKSIRNLNKEKKRKRSKSCKRKNDQTFGYEQVALVTASLISGAYFLSNIGSQAQSGILSAVKNTSSFAVSSFLKLVKKE